MNNPQMSLTQQPVEEVHLTDYLNVIIRRRQIFLLSFLAFFLGVAIFTYNIKPIYEASATIHVRDDKSKGGILSELTLNPSNPIDAEIEILKSRTNSADVVQRLHLNRVISQKSPGLSFTVAEFSSSAAKPSYKIELTGPDSYSVSSPDQTNSIPGKSGQLLTTATFSLQLNDLKGKTGDSFKLDLHSVDHSANRLRAGIKASVVGKNTNIIRISFNSSNPVYARDIVNALTQSYLEQTISYKTEEASRTVTFVEEQLQNIRNDLDQAEINLQGYKSANGIMRLDTESEELVKKMSEVDKELANLTFKKKLIEFSLAAQQDARRKGHTYTPVFFKDDSQLGSIATRLTELEVQKRAQALENTENYPASKSIQTQIDQLQKKIQSIYEASLRDLTKQEEVIKLQLAQFSVKLRSMPATERDLARLMRISKVNADIYLMLLQKHEEARIVKASTISNIRIVDPAITPERPIKPNKKKNLLLGLLVGLMFGIGAAFFMDYLDDTIKDEDEAKRILGWPMLAMIPAIEDESGGSDPADRAWRLIVQHKPKSSVSEAFRGLRTAIHFSSFKRDSKVLMVTSSFPGEGKTTIAANLALTFAQAGKRVLLVDCDLRRPSLNTIFGYSRTPGVSEVLAGDVSMDEALHITDIDNISLLTAGTIPPNPAELLSSASIRDHLAELRGSYEIIILDAPPVIPVTDAPLLTAFADLVIVVVESGRIPAKAAQRMKELLLSVQAPVAGFVLNDRSSLYSDSYGYYGKGYYGSRYYGKRYYGYAYYGIDDQKAKTVKKPWWRKFLIGTRKDS